MTFVPPERFNLADYFLDARIREGKGDSIAIVTDDAQISYGETVAAANQFANVLRGVGVRPEERVMIALPDGPAFVAAFFGVIKMGAVVVMVNPELHAEAVADLCAYTRSTAAIVDPTCRDAFHEAKRSAPCLAYVLVQDRALDEQRGQAPSSFVNFPTHRDDAAIWLFSGGTTGTPKAVVQTHTSFANTTECYAKQVLELTETDVTISVPKLYFGYATGSNLLFPFSVGARSVLFAERCTPETLFEKIERHRPTVLINVPTMVNKMVSDPSAKTRDLSSLRLCTSAGEALPEELFHRWHAVFGVELLDGLGTAEMWHIFISNRPGAARPGTLGTAVPGFEVRVCDEDGQSVPDGQTGYLWVRGNSRAQGYWQHGDKTRDAFRGEWYVSGDLLERDTDGYFRYRGRADELLKVAGKWLAPQEVESCLLEHPAVREAAVVGVTGPDGLIKPHAFVVAQGASDGLAEALKEHVRRRLDAYKHPREVVFLDVLPRTHLGKVDRGKLRK